MHAGCVCILDLPLLESLGEAVSLLQKEALLVWCVHVATLHEGMVLGLTERGRYAGGVRKGRRRESHAHTDSRVLLNSALPSMVNNRVPQFHNPLDNYFLLRIGMATA